MRKEVLAAVIIALCLAPAASALDVAVRDADSIISEVAVAPGPSPSVLPDELIAKLKAGRALSTGVTLAELSRAQLDLLRAQGYTAYEPVKVYATLAESLPQVRADEAHALPHPVRGTGTVCVIDTGVNYDHEMLGGGGFPNSKVVGGTDVYNGDEDPADDNGHGSHVSSTVAGDGTLAGVAPGATVVHAKTLGADGTGNLELLAEAIAWCTNHSAEHNISVISMSLGEGGTYNEFTCPDNSSADPGYASSHNAIEAAYQAGITLVASSGNTNTSAGLVFPACNPRVVSVGSVGDGTSSSSGGTGCLPRNTVRDVISTFTATHRTLDLLAPGACITAASHVGNGLADKGGTSMAAPHVAGALLLLQQYEERLGITQTREERVERLKESGAMIARGSRSWPRIDIMAALAATLPLELTFPDTAYCTDCAIDGNLTHTHENASGINVTLTVQSEEPARLFVNGEEVNGTNNTFPLGVLAPLETKALRVRVQSSGEELVSTIDASGVQQRRSTLVDSVVLVAPEEGAATPGRLTYRVESIEETTHECSVFVNGTNENTTSAPTNTNITHTTNTTGNLTWNVSCTRDGTTGWSGTRSAFSDTSEPTITAVLNESLFRPNETAVLNATVIDDGEVVSVTSVAPLARNGSRWNGTVTMNASGIPITAVDAAGNVATRNYTNYTIDGDAPVVWNLSPMRSLVSSVTFVWRVNDTTATTCTHAVRNETPVAAGRNRTVNLSEGNHSWSVNCTDAVGWSTVEESWTLVDLAAPVIEEVRLAPAIVQPFSPARLTFRATDSVGVARVVADGETLDGVNGSYNDTYSENETKSISIAATDLAGRSTQEFITLTIDGVAPVVSLVVENESNSSVVTSTPLIINWSINESYPSNTTVFIDGNALNSSNRTRGSEAATTLPGPRRLSITSTDAAGNTGRAARNVTANTTVNTTALAADLSAMLGEEVTLFRDGEALSGTDHLDGGISLIITRPGGSWLSLFFQGLDARWGEAWSVGRTTHDFIDEVHDSFALELGDFLTPDAVALSAWFNTTNGTHAMALDGNESLPLAECPDPEGCFNATGGRVSAEARGVTGFVALRDMTPPAVSVTPASAAGSSPVVVTLTVETDEWSSCRHDANDVAYAAMTGAFASDGFTHTTERTYTSSTTETFFIACRDGQENEARDTHVLTVTVSQPITTTSAGGGGGGGGGYIPEPRAPETTDENTTSPPVETAAGAEESKDIGEPINEAVPASAPDEAVELAPAPLVSSVDTPQSRITGAVVEEKARTEAAVGEQHRWPVLIIAFAIVIGSLIYARQNVVTRTRQK